MQVFTGAMTSSSPIEGGQWQGWAAQLLEMGFTAASIEQAQHASACTTLEASSLALWFSYKPVGDAEHL